MFYDKLKTPEFFDRVTTEEEARNLFWRTKYEGKKDFECTRCFHEQYYQHRARPEIRECRQCGKQVRMRPGTLLEHSKIAVLVWLRAIFLMVQDKRGVSATQVRRQLAMKSYGTTWHMLHKIRVALGRRDERYKLKDVIELDGADFDSEAHRKANGAADSRVLLAIETKSWIDERARPKSRAGFAKVAVSRETSIFAQRLVNKAVEPGTMVNTDGGNAFTNLKGVDVDSRVMGGIQGELNNWLPWVHRFISNAKTWILGTHHSVSAKYLERYLAEHTYRFNRRHDPDGLFHRALTACALSTPVTRTALTLAPATSG